MDRRRSAPAFPGGQLTHVGKGPFQQAPPVPGQAGGKGRMLYQGDTEVACAGNVAGRPPGTGTGFALFTTDALLSPYCLHTESVQYAFEV